MRIVCDSSALISLCENCLAWLLRDAAKKAEIFIPPKVKEEIVDNPLMTKRFELRAIQLNHLLQGGTIKVFSDKKIPELSWKIVNLANALFTYKKRPVKILHPGEAEAVACIKILGDAIFLVDERTVRLLIEDPDDLKKYMEERTGYVLEINKDVRRELENIVGGIDIIRSADFFASAYQTGLLDKYETEKILEAGLYGLRFSGCAVSEGEIKEYIRMLV